MTNLRYVRLLGDLKRKGYFDTRHVALRREDPTDADVARAGLSRKYVRLREQGRRLASQREDLIAAGVDPAELLVPLHPIELRSRRAGRHADLDSLDAERQHARDLARVWLIVAAACFASFVGCVATTGAMLVVAQEPTWHVWAAASGGVGWFIFAFAAAAHTDRLRRWARDGEADAPSR